MIRGTIAALLLAVTMPAVTVYQISVDTTSLSGTSGGLYLQFNPGLNADPATATVTPVSLPAPGGFSAGPALVNGAVTGLLPAAVTLSNTSGLNDYYQFIDFGAELVVEVVLALPAALTGSGGSAFALGLTASDGLTPLLTLDPAGFLAVISFDVNGVFALDALSPQASIQELTAVPEPSSLGMVAVLLALAAWPALVRRTATQRSSASAYTGPAPGDGRHAKTAASRAYCSL